MPLLEPAALVAGRGLRISAIALQRVNSSSGIERGVDVGRELPKLTTYLGHVDVAHTYWYLEAVPELLQLATERLGGHRAGGGQ